MSLKVEHLIKNYKNECILNNINFSLETKESIALLGKSGSGKTTLAKCISMLEYPSSGKIIYDNIEISNLNFNARRKLRTQIQYIFQDQLNALNPKKTAKQLIDDVLRNFNLNADASNLEHVLSDAKFKKSLLNKKSDQLSGGERQRLGIVRAMLVKPKILILDEVTSALNKELKKDIMHSLEHYRDLHNSGMIFITHEVNLAKEYFQRAIIIENSRLIFDGKTTEI